MPPPAVRGGDVEEVDADVARRSDEFADLIVGHVRDTHQAEDNAGDGDPGVAERDDLHVARTPRISQIWEDGPFQVLAGHPKPRRPDLFSVPWTFAARSATS